MNNFKKIIVSNILTIASRVCVNRNVTPVLLLGKPHNLLSHLLKAIFSQIYSALVEILKIEGGDFP